VDLRAGPDRCGKSRPALGFDPRTVQPAGSRYYATGPPAYRVEVKAVPSQAWSGPEDSRKLKFPDFMTTAQDGGKVVSLTHQPPLPPGYTPGTHFC
jgi:hypothetical protein